MGSTSSQQSGGADDVVPDTSVCLGGGGRDRGGRVWDGDLGECFVLLPSTEVGAGADFERAQDGYADFGLFGTTGYENWERDLKRGTVDFVYLVGTSYGESCMRRLPRPALKSHVEFHGAARPTANSFSQATYLRRSPAQSEIWKLDSRNSRLVPTWTNADGRIADATIVYVPHSRAFALVADMDVYMKMYGDA